MYDFELFEKEDLCNRTICSEQIYAIAVDIISRSRWILCGLYPSMDKEALPLNC